MNFFCYILYLYTIYIYIYILYLYTIYIYIYIYCRYYSATIVRMSGVSDDCQAIWLASVTAFSNFIFTFVGIAVVERIGRRTLFLASLAGTPPTVTMLLMRVRTML